MISAKMAAAASNRNGDMGRTPRWRMLIRVPSLNPFLV
jgi:hypothetical protein